MSDAYSAHTVLLLHMEGSNGSTDFVDSSNVQKSITVNGDAKISTSQSKWSNGSGYFDGSGDYLTVPYTTIFDFGSNDLTIEAWVYITGNSSPDISGFRSASIVCSWTSSIRGLIFRVCGDTTTIGTGLALDTWGGSGDGTQYIATVTVSQNAWHHIAGSIQSGTRRLFLDGVLLSGSTNTVGYGYTQANSFNPINIGKTNNTDYPLPLNGYLQDLRISRDVARYTDTFTVPSAKLPDPDPATGLIMPSQYRSDIYDGGSLKIIEPVTLLNSPVSRRVRLCDQISGRVARESWSDADTGDVTFNNLREGPWVLYALDHTGEYEAVAISDRLATADGERP